MRRASHILAAILLPVFALGLSAQEEVYTYVDENGTIHFTDLPKEGAMTIIIGASGLPVTAHRLDPDVPFNGILSAAAARYQLDPALLAAVAKVESDFNPKAVSHAGAKGVMQLMDATAKEYGVANVFDPHENIDAGARHLRDLLLAFKGDLRLSLAAYNAGRSAVQRHGGVPPYSETRRYIQKIAALYGDLDSRISTRQIENSYAAARTFASGGDTLYRYDTADGLSYSEIPPIGRSFEIVLLRR